MCKEARRVAQQIANPDGRESRREREEFSLVVSSSKVLVLVWFCFCSTLVLLYSYMPLLPFYFIYLCFISDEKIDKLIKTLFQPNL